MISAMTTPSLAKRCPRRITTTIPNTVFSSLEQRSLREGRSLSNLAAHLLECALLEVASSTTRADEPQREH